MTFFISPHARERMELRNITEKMITETVDSPDTTEKSFRGRSVVCKRFGEHILKIPLIEEHGVTTVITVIWES